MSQGRLALRYTSYEFYYAICFYFQNPILIIFYAVRMSWVLTKQRWQITTEVCATERFGLAVTF